MVQRRKEIKYFDSFMTRETYLVVTMDSKSGCERVGELLL